MEATHEVVVDEAQAREYLKQAVADLVARKPEVLREVVEEVLEDRALSRAIEEGQQTELVSGDQVMRTLDDLESGLRSERGA